MSVVSDDFIALLIRAKVRAYRAVAVAWVFGVLFGAGLGIAFDLWRKCS